MTTGQVFRDLFKTRGFFGFYRGYLTLVARKIYFDAQNNAFYSGLLGAVAGSTAAFCTTPLDVAKTRQMLDQSKKGSESTMIGTLKNIYRAEGVNGLFKGVVPRVCWIAVGGFIFLGSYDFARMNLPF